MIVGHIGGSSSGGYEIQKSLRFRASASAHLSRTPASAGNRKTWTWSKWVKRGTLGSIQTLFDAYTNGSNSSSISFTSADQLQVSNYVAASLVTNKVTTQVFRDPSAWYHIVVSSNGSTSLNIYVNGVQVTSFAPNVGPTAANWFFNGANAHRIGTKASGGSPTQLLDGYLAEVNFIDGQALDPSYFGQVSAETGAWIPKKYTGTYGTNGFYLDFNGVSTLTSLCSDKSGNGNNWTANNISLTSGSSYDWMDDTPTNNFAVLNPLETIDTGNTFSNANLRVTTGTTGFGFAVSTVGASSGQFYFEVTPTVTDGVEAYIGVQDSDPSALKALLYDSTGTVQEWVTVKASGLPTYTTNDVIGVAFNATTNSVSFYKNGTLVGAYSYSSPPTNWAACLLDGSTSGGNTYDINFGQRPFAYTPPSGFKALCTKNLPAPSILNPKKHFDVRTRAGTGSAATVTGIPFAPDLVWIKARAAAYSHNITDSVRGAAKTLISNATAAEEQNRTVGYVSAFTSDGYSLSAGSSSIAEVGAATTYVDWLWKAGGAPVTNNAGSIQSQVSANPQAGFSIVTYTGTGANATVGHGLGVAPKMVIVKRRNSTGDWLVWNLYVALTGSDRVLFLNTTDSQTPADTNFNSSSPTSSVVNLGTNAATNASGGTHVAYCFAEIPGYSKIGSYTGNGSADGPFVFCGFRPAFVLVKRSDSTGTWYLVDNKRNGTNSVHGLLYPNLSNAEATINWDILSNGFKMRDNGADLNANGGTYIFIAIAENPFKYSLAR